MSKALQRDFPGIVETLVEHTQTLNTHENAIHHIDRDRHLKMMRGYHRGIVRCIKDGDPYTARQLLINWVGKLNLWSDVVGVTFELYWHESTTWATGVYSYSAVDLLLGVKKIRNIANTRKDKRWLKSQIDKGLQPATIGNRLTRQPQGLTPQGKKRIRRR